MKNFNIKVIIIILFIFVCAAACFIIAHPLPAGSADTDSTELLTSFLSKHGIEVAGEVFTAEHPKVCDASANNTISDKSLFAEKFFNGTAAMSNDGNEFTFGSDKLTISSTSFSYTAKSLPYKAELSNINLDNAGAKAKEIAEMRGFDLSGSIIQCAEENGIYTLTITKSLYGLPIFNDVMTLTMSADGLSSIKGVWFSVSNAKKRDAKSISAALIELINNPECPGKAEVTDMELGYTLLDPAQNETKLKPVWHIILSDGKVFSVDA